MKEDIINLPPTETKQPLYIPMVGIAHWDKNYFVKRNLFGAAVLNTLYREAEEWKLTDMYFTPLKGIFASFLFIPITPVERIQMILG